MGLERRVTSLFTDVRLHYGPVVPRTARRATAYLGALVLLASLIVGLVPHQTQTALTSEISCGSAFAPNLSPDGVNLESALAGAVGASTDGIATEDSSSLLTACNTAMAGVRALAITLGVLGGAVLLSLVSRRRDRRRAAFQEAARAAEQRQADEAVERVDQEARWRARGWVPAEELEEPPLGWVRLHSAES
jgi:hypothetical protein